MKNISIIGSTGSIGTQALDYIKYAGHRVTALAAGSNAELLCAQAEEHRPEVAVIFDESKLSMISPRLNPLGIRTYAGSEGIKLAAQHEEADTVLNAAVGIAGLMPTIHALEAGKRLALANKESLVCAGDIVMGMGGEIIPVDSEHSAVFQCLLSGKRDEVRRIILTASGGPFFGMEQEELANVTVRQALAHPTWSMGKKISIDSATMMNKGFELIEAMYLFHAAPDMLDIAVHRQSIVHSMVEFRDGACIAQMSHPDMRLAIGYAIDYPHRRDYPERRLDFTKAGNLTFSKVDEEKFTSVKLCRDVMEKKGTMGCALNAANEAAVELFLQERIRYLDIMPVVERAVKKHSFTQKPTLEQIIMTDKAVKALVYEDFNT